MELVYNWVWIQASAPKTSLTSSTQTWEGDIGLGIGVFLGVVGGSRGGSLNAFALESAGRLWHGGVDRRHQVEVVFGV